MIGYADKMLSELENKTGVTKTKPKMLDADYRIKKMVENRRATYRGESLKEQYRKGRGK